MSRTRSGSATRFSACSTRAFPAADFAPLSRAFDDFAALFEGRYPGYLACDTLYHDIRHTLDMTLAMARLVDGHERASAAADRLGARRAMLGVLVALLHDSGYLKRSSESHVENGAVFTKIHVSRSADFISTYLPRLGFERRDAARHAPGALHRLRDGDRGHPRRRPEGPPDRLHGRHGGPDRADVRPHVPREMPRVPVPRVRGRQGGARDAAERQGGGALRFAPRTWSSRRRASTSTSPARASTASSAASTATSPRISTAPTSTRPRSTATWISCAARSRRPTSAGCAASAIRFPRRRNARRSAEFVTFPLKILP